MQWMKLKKSYKAGRMILNDVSNSSNELKACVRMCQQVNTHLKDSSIFVDAVCQPTVFSMCLIFFRNSISAPKLGMGSKQKKNELLMSCTGAATHHIAKTSWGSREFMTQYFGWTTFFFLLLQQPQQQTSSSSSNALYLHTFFKIENAAALHKVVSL